MTDAPEASPETSGLCPSCGRHAGPVPKCPHCGALVQTRLSLRIMRWSCIPLALAGIVFLLVWARSRDVETVKVSEITRTMSMGYVRIEGVADRVFVKRSPTGAPAFLSLQVDDGTGSARVFVNAHAARRLEEENRVPRRGDRVIVEGTVRVGAEGEVSLSLPAAKALELVPSDIPVVEPSEMSLAMAGKTVQVEGEVSRLYAPRPGSKAPFRALLTDGKATVSLVFWSDLSEPLLAKGLGEGAKVVARVEVASYKGKVQCKLAKAEDLTVSKMAPPGDEAGPEVEKPRPGPEPKDGTVATGKVRYRKKGETVTIAGTVMATRAIKGGLKLSVDDGSGSVDVVLWDKVLAGLDTEEEVKKGTVIRVTAKVSVYKRWKQVNPSRAEDVKVGE